MEIFLNHIEIWWLHLRFDSKNIHDKQISNHLKSSIRIATEHLENNKK
jgi:hypothetical protein